MTAKWAGRLFPILHATNAATALVYTLAQTLVLARGLDRAAFSQSIAVTAIGFYLLPLSQAVARANFMVIRKAAVEEGRAGGHPEAALAFHVSQGAAVLAGLVGPMLIVGREPPVTIVAMTAFALFATLSNPWYFEIQSALLAIDRPVTYELANLGRRLANMAALAWFLVSHDFLTFTLLLLAQAVVAQAVLMRLVARQTDLFDIPRPRAVGRAAGRAHLGRLWTAAQATFAEWLTQNGPYAVFMARFGVGPGLIGLDIGMKLLRASLTVTRSLSEIGLPHISRALLTGAADHGRRTALAVLALGLAPSLAIAGLLLWDERAVFHALLGPNAVAPSGAGAAFALAIVAGVGFQAGAHFVGYLGRAGDVALFTILAIVSFIGAAGWILLGRADDIGALWAICLAFAATSAGGLFALSRVLMLIRH